MAYVVVDGRLAGLLGVADPVKDSAREAVAEFHRARLRVVMLTSDTRTTAGAVARTLGLDDVRAEVLPEQKGRVIEELHTGGYVVAMASTTPRP